MVVVVNKWDLVLQQWNSSLLMALRMCSNLRKPMKNLCANSSFSSESSGSICLPQRISSRVLIGRSGSSSRFIDVQLPTGRLNRLIERLFEARSPKIVGTKRFKVFYAVQTGNKPFRIRFFCNRIERLDPSYRRYLEKAILHEFALRAVPFVLI